MADRKISDLTALTAPASGDYLPIVDISEAAAASKNKRITIEELMRGAPDGTAAAPSIAFESDPNTGIYSPGADQVAVSTGGTGRLFVASDGKVGIGASSPGSLLNLAHPTVSDIRLTVAGTLVGNIYGSSSDLNVHAVANVPLTFATNNTERARINSSGNVGIGTSSPATLLQLVQASAGTVGTFNVASSTGGGSEIRVANGYSSTVPIYSFWFNNTTGIGNPAVNEISAIITGSERARIDSSGRLLVGTSSALTTFFGTAVDKLAIAGGAAPQVIGCYSANEFGPRLDFVKSRSATTNGQTVVLNNDALGEIYFGGSDGTAPIPAARIHCAVDGTPGTNDMPGRLMFSTTADGAATPTERFRITSAGVLQVADAGNITVGTTTGTKIGTATTQKLGFYNATPVVQPTAVADATDAATVITQLNALLTRMRNLGLIAT
jgi:hypothetical protein